MKKIFPFYYMGGGWYRELGTPKGESATMLHGEEVIKIIERLEKRISKNLNRAITARRKLAVVMKSTETLSANTPMSTDNDIIGKIAYRIYQHTGHQNPLSNWIQAERFYLFYKEKALTISFNWDWVKTTLESCKN